MKSSVVEVTSYCSSQVVLVVVGGRRGEALKQPESTPLHRQRGEPQLFFPLLPPFFLPPDLPPPSSTSCSFHPSLSFKQPERSCAAAAAAGEEGEGGRGPVRKGVKCVYVCVFVCTA